ncbi:hypothetical protein [Leptospira barantonii]|uniref:hypothetical protein n=1 Tax=Leptospira barantonii TaxID=2023184 RepID=UPI000F645D34|nr:hypothetical protein [Leptospira barantonii]
MKILYTIFLIFLTTSFSLIAQTSFEKKGFYSIKSQFPCALGNYGFIGKENSCVRLSLFDDYTKVEVNEYSIELQNSQSYEEETLFFDLLVPGTCETDEGKKRINIHYKIEKKGKKLNPQIHAHFTSRKKCKTAEMENFEIKLREGEKSSILISKEDSSNSVLSPTLTSKFLKELVQVVDNLENTSASKTSETDRKVISDITIQVGKGKLSKNITNCKFTITGGDTAPKKDVISTLNETDWEIQLQSLTSFFPKTVLITELSLIGIDDPSLVQYIRTNGLPKRESLVFKKSGSNGVLIWPQGRIELKNYQNVVKSFFTGTFTGSIFLEKLESSLRP